MSSTQAPTADAIMLSVHAVQQYQQRLKPGLDLHGARNELERLCLAGEISAEAPDWLHARRPAPFYVLLGEVAVLPLLPQTGGWVATTCVAQQTMTPTRRGAKAARKASLRSRKRAERRARP